MEVDIKNFILSIEGLSSENLTTEILSLILQSPEFALYQRIFFNYLLDPKCLKSTEEWGFTISTQYSCGELGRPDMAIFNNDRILLFENKFYAPYSCENQISRYIEILEKNFDSTYQKNIYLLTIRSRKLHYQNKIKKDLYERGLRSRECYVKYLIWEDILNLFDSDNFVLKNLNTFITNRFLIKMDFSKGDIAMLDNVAFPKALNGIFTLIPMVKDLIQNTYLVERLSQSYNFFGFYIRKEKVKCWFGYFLPLWVNPPFPDICTPLYLQIREEWLDKEVDRVKFNHLILQLGFIKHKDQHWVKPYNLTLLDASNNESELNIDTLVQLIGKDIECIHEFLVKIDTCIQ